MSTDQLLLRARRLQRLFPMDGHLAVAGCVLVVLGLVHGPVQLFDPRPWESPMGWRKPILFGVSTGVTLLSLAWVMALVRRDSRHGGLQRRDLGLCAMMDFVAIAAVVEVVLITVQTWRGVPAHFNMGTPFDAGVGLVVDALLVGITVGIGWLSWRAWRPGSLTRVPPDLRAAVRLGLALLLLACGAGFWVAWHGHQAVLAGQDPAVLPPRGVPKFLHGMPLHALQFLPLTAVGLRLLGTRRGVPVIGLVALALTTATGYAAWQTLTGRGRFEVNTVGVALVCVTVAIIAAACIVGLMRVMRGRLCIRKPKKFSRRSEGPLFED